MRIGHALLPLCAAIALAGLARADEPGMEPIGGAFDACMEHPRIAKRGEDLPDLAEICPAVHAAVAAAQFAPMLPGDWSERATAARLSQLRRLLDAPVPGAAAPRLDPAGVATILEQIRASQVVAVKSLWQRFRDWLERILERRTEDDGSGWLAEWIREHMPAVRAMRWIAYGLMALLIAGAVWVVVSELRANGLLRRSTRARADRARAAGGLAPADRAVSLKDASDEELPALLIALLLERLRVLGRVQDRQSMTHRELAAAARFESADDGSVFSALVATAERLRYASVAPARAQLHAVVEAARALLARLLQAPRSAT